MTKRPTIHGNDWTPSQARELSALAKQNTPSRVTALKLGRTEGSMRSRAGSESISLKPTKQYPFNRRKK